MLPAASAQSFLVFLIRLYIYRRTLSIIFFIFLRWKHRRRKNENQEKKKKKKIGMIENKRVKWNILWWRWRTSLGLFSFSSSKTFPKLSVERFQTDCNTIYDIYDKSTRLIVLECHMTVWEIVHYITFISFRWTIL